MVGMNAYTGGMLEGIPYLKQCIGDILATPLGARLMRRSYGSRLMALVDQPINSWLTAQLQAAAAEALMRCSSPFKLTRVQVLLDDDSSLTLKLEGTYEPHSQPIMVEQKMPKPQ